jgi:hypothetical protein
VIGTMTVRAEAGTAACPVRGRIDTERCLSCTGLRSIRRQDGALAIRCRPSRSVMASVPPYGSAHIDPLS